MSLRRDKGADPLAAKKRGRLTRAAIIVIAVVIVLVIPGYLAGRPHFFKSFPALTDQYEAWSTSTHVEVGCEACHVPPRPIDHAAYRVRLVGEFYLSLVFRLRKPDLFKTPTNAACLVCHSDLRTVSPKGDLQIPHRAHVTVLKMQCVECHSFLVHALSPAGSHEPPMTGCLTCHDGDRAVNGCTACHTRKAAPATHARADWIVVHSASATDAACGGCHKWTADWCVDCHRDRPQSHTPDWRETHGAAIAKHRSCEACHRGDFCARCHGDVPQLNLDPTLALVE